MISIILSTSSLQSFSNQQMIIEIIPSIKYLIKYFWILFSTPYKVAIGIKILSFRSSNFSFHFKIIFCLFKIPLIKNNFKPFTYNSF